MDRSFLYLMLWAAVFGIIFAVLIKKGWLFGGIRLDSSKERLDRSLVASKWREIETLMNQGKTSSYKVAVMDADKLLDYVLKTKVGAGGTMKDRLIKSKGLYSNYQTYKDAGFAHGYRNRVVHEADHELHLAEVKKVISYFKKALQELKAL